MENEIQFHPCNESIIHFLIWKQNEFWKCFIFYFSISLPKLKNQRIFWNSLFDLKSKNEFENFDFCFLKLVLNQNRFIDSIDFFRFSFFNSIIKFEKWKVFFEIRFLFQIKKRITKFWILLFAFLFEMGHIKVCFERWILK